MEIKEALTLQYQAGLAMLRQCVELCPDDLWLSGTHPRTYWRIVFHAAICTHLMMVQNEAAFEVWPGHRPDLERLWTDPGYLEPYEMDEGVEPVSREHLLDYIDYVLAMVGPVVAGVDLESPETGYRWYPDMSKMSHELMNLRHLQGHVGQLSELLMMRGIDIDWIAEGRASCP